MRGPLILTKATHIYFEYIDISHTSKMLVKTQLSGELSTYEAPPCLIDASWKWWKYKTDVGTWELRHTRRAQHVRNGKTLPYPTMLSSAVVHLKHVDNFVARSEKETLFLRLLVGLSYLSLRFYFICHLGPVDKWGNLPTLHESFASRRLTQLRVVLGHSQLWTVQRILDCLKRL